MPRFDVPIMAQPYLAKPRDRAEFYCKDIEDCGGTECSECLFNISGWNSRQEVHLIQWEKGKGIYGSE